MKKYKYISMIVILAGMLLTTSCGDDFLTAESAGDVPSGSPATEDIIFANLTATYQVLLRDNYSGGYNSISINGDLRSDDAYKGGDGEGDQPELANLAYFTSSPSSTPAGLWLFFYTGVARANYTLLACERAVEGSDMAIVNRYKAEALLLRAYFMHILWKNWGNIPFFTAPLEEPFIAPQYSVNEIYNFIMADIAAVEELDNLPMRTKGAELGRLNKAALYMLKARVVMYHKDNSKYDEVADNMAEIITSNDYDLFGDFDAMWLDENEWCIENIFETNQVNLGGKWEDAWDGFGTVLPRMIAPNSFSNGETGFLDGWGFAPVRPYVWNELYEDGDTRKAGSVNDWRGYEYKTRTHDTGFFYRKYAARVGYNQNPNTDLGFCNNYRIYRFAETLLNYAELVGINGASAKRGVNAQDCFDRVRRRAFGKDAPLALNQNNLELERRREFVGEGMRFWDLVRWGKAATTLTENHTITSPKGDTWKWSRTFTEEKKYLPISEREINVTKGTQYELKQNPGWN